MPDGICPFAVWRPTTNFGYPGGIHGQNKPLIFVDHIMGGYKSTMDNLAWLNGSGISAHFGIGKDGSISQYVSILDASYASGVVGQAPRGNRRGIELYERANPLLAQIELEARANWYTVETRNGPKWTMSIGAANAWNVRSISTEHEGVNQNDPWTPAMLEADIRVKRWCNAELQRVGLPPIQINDHGLLGHFNIDHIDRPYCPGPGWPKAQLLAALAPEENEMANLNTDGSQRIVAEGPCIVIYNANIPVLRIGSEDGRFPGQLAKNFGGTWVYFRNDGQPNNPAAGEGWWSVEPGD